MLNKVVQQYARSSVLCWLASSDTTGQPNVSPKEMFLCHSDTELVIANIASPQTAQNIRVNPLVAVSFIDVFDQRGFSILGKAEVIERSASDQFEKYGSELEKMAGPHFPITSVFLITVKEVRPIVAPSYKLRPELTADERRASVYKSYGVTPSDLVGRMP